MVLTLSVSTFALASESTVNANGYIHDGTNGCAFIDKNGDGICDNGDSHCANFVDADGDGLCDNRDNHCTNYSDANGDGVCDNCSGHGIHETAEIHAKHSGGAHNACGENHNSGNSGKHNI